MNYKIEKFELVKNQYYYFYLVSIDGKNQFKTFVEEVEKSKLDLKSLYKIFSIMDFITPYIKLPKEKFRHIEPSNNKERNDLFEFKEKSLRVYVILQFPSIYIIRGGWKKDQLKDISKLKRDTKDFPEILYS